MEGATGPAGAVFEIDLPTPGPARPIFVPSGGANHLIIGTRAILYGYSLKETTGSSAAEVEVLTGNDDTGTIIAVIELASGVSDTQWFGDMGVLADSGIFLKMVNGSVTGSIWARHIWRR